MEYKKFSSAPNWSEIMARRPELESPGYQECLAAIRAKADAYQENYARELMQKIHREKQGYRTKNRGRPRKS
jgi:hypothetical protein